jgi:hypothetical protein
MTWDLLARAGGISEFCDQFSRVVRTFAVRVTGAGGVSQVDLV